MQLGESIKEIRERRGLTQEQLAEQAGINVIHLGHLEQGRREPRLNTLRKLAGALGVRVKDIIPF